MAQVFHSRLVLAAFCLAAILSTSASAAILDLQADVAAGSTCVAQPAGLGPRPAVGGLVWNQRARGRRNSARAQEPL